MPKRRKSKAAATEATGGHRVSAEEKIARLLAMLLVRDIKNKTDQVPLLRRAGFDVAEVADILSMSANHVKVADNLGRKKKPA